MSGICNEQGDFENIIFSYANIADCKMAEKLAEVVKGTIFADAGYLQKKDVLKRMEEDGIKFEAAPRKNMNRLMSRFECYHIKHRSIIESDWGTLKNNFQLEYHKARSIVGMFRHFFYSIAAYMINRNLDFNQNFFRLRLIQKTRISGYSKKIIMATETIITEKQSVIHEQEVVQKEVKPSRSEAVSKGMLAYLLWKNST